MAARQHSEARNAGGLCRQTRFAKDTAIAYLYWQAQNKKTLQLVNQLIKDTERTPYEGIGKPEPLRGTYPASGHAD